MVATQSETVAASGPTPAAPELGGIDHIEWWVGNARAFAGFLVSAFGFEPVAYAGPETGRTDRVSHLLRQGRIQFLVTGALGPESPIAEHVLRHGDGVRDVAFVVDDAAAAYEAALRRGARPERAPADDEDEHGVIHHAAIRTYGETVHTFLDRADFHGVFAPQFTDSPLEPAVGPPVGLERVDHVVGNVERGTLDEWVAYYEQVLGFDKLTHFDDDQISTEYSALMSTVVWDHDKVVLPINEPADGRKKSQIEEYLDYYRSPGVQHVALRTPDIVQAVRALRDRGVRFMEVPPEYYDEARERLAGVELPWDALAELGVLVDRDEEGHLLQIFTETVTDRPTVFFEIIQREGARGFGEGNFKALFESIERAQAARGNL
ncbi:MAG TPA: 4-hydroxyphenylpyruvate dioxygenase [Acidimicrobiales bacterium]